jgi:Skp family chaperone for outer membrane proteins
MKKHISKLVIASVLFLGLTVPAFGQGRTATLDLRKVFDNYWKKNEADNALQDRAAEMEKEFKGLTDDYTKAKADYAKLQADAADSAVAADEREKRKKAAEAKLLEIHESEQTIESFRRQAAATLDEQKRRMRDKIIGEIKNVVNAKAKSASYAFVVDTSAESANGTPVLMYSSGENDITDDVLKQLNANAPAGTLKPTSPDKSSDTPKATDKAPDKKK